MAVGSKNLTTEQLRGLEDGPLRDALTEAKKELFNLRFQSATGQLESHGRLKAVRKDIARIYTEMRERELGIGRAPAGTGSEDDTTETEKVG
jgi:large subunit ribosomal protein L29